MSVEVNYESKYYAGDYPNKHPYFQYMVNKYEPLANSYDRIGKMLLERLKYLDSIDASRVEKEHVKNQIDRAFTYSFEMQAEFVWSDDEEDDYDSPNHIFKSEVQFYSIWRKNET